MLDGFGGSRAAGEIALAAGIAPGALRIPVPRLHRKFCVLAIGYGLPSGREYSRQRRLTEILLHGGSGHSVNARAERLVGNEGGVICIHPNGLTVRSGSQYGRDNE